MRVILLDRGDVELLAMDWLFKVKKRAPKLRLERGECGQTQQRKPKISDLLKTPKHTVFGLHRSPSMPDVVDAMRRACLAHNDDLEYDDPSSDVLAVPWDEVLVAYRLLLKESPASVLTDRAAYSRWTPADLLPTLRALEGEDHEYEMELLLYQSKVEVMDAAFQAAVAARSRRREARRREREAMHRAVGGAGPLEPLNEAEEERQLGPLPVWGRLPKKAAPTISLGEAIEAHEAQAADTAKGDRRHGVKPPLELLPTCGCRHGKMHYHRGHTQRQQARVAGQLAAARAARRRATGQPQHTFEGSHARDAPTFSGDGGGGGDENSSSSFGAGIGGGSGGGSGRSGEEEHQEEEDQFDPQATARAASAANTFNPLLSRAAKMLVVRIPYIESAQLAGRLPHTVYVLLVNYSLRAHTVRRRYSDFERLNDFMAQNLTMVPAFPAKSLFYTLGLADATDRAVLLCKWLERLVLSLAERGMYSEAVMSFLGVDTHRVRCEEEARIVRVIDDEASKTEDRAARWYIIDERWLSEWRAFVGGETRRPPGPIDNRRLLGHLDPSLSDCGPMYVENDRVREAWLQAHLESADPHERDVGRRYGASKALLTKDLQEHWQNLTPEEQRPFCEAWRAQQNNEKIAGDVVLEMAGLANKGQVLKQGGSQIAATTAVARARSKLAFTMSDAQCAGHNKKQPLTIVKVRRGAAAFTHTHIQGSPVAPAFPLYALLLLHSTLAHPLVLRSDLPPCAQRATAVSARMCGACCTASTAGGQQSSARNLISTRPSRPLRAMRRT